jgi:hypothetical protein
MRRLLVSVVFTAALCGAVQAAPNDADARYQAMVAAAKADPQTVDWQALRFAFADRPSFMQLNMSLNDTRKKMLAARRSRDFNELLAQANAIIDQDYVDGQAHMLAGVAMAALQQPDAAREQSTAIAILKSIQTGDGLTPGTAFTVISVSEEYELMFARQRKVNRQLLQNANGHAYDVLETTGRNGDAVTFYFLIDRVMAAEAKAFASKAERPD